MSSSKEIIKYLDGKKTYIIAAAVVILGFLQGFEIWEVPETGWLILSAFGLASMRSAVNKIGNTINEVKK